MKNLSERERYLIEHYLNRGFNGMQIAKILNRPFQTIYKEIKRGSIELLNSDLTIKTVYLADVGQRVKTENGKNKGRNLAIGNNIELANRIEELIVNEKYSPYSALEICKKEKLNVNICETTLYSYIYKGVFLKLKPKHLPYYRKKNKTNNEKRISLKNVLRTSIEERPKHINKRSTFGHWELDTVVGKQGTKECLFVFTERKTRKEIIKKASNRTIESCVKIIDELENKYKDDFKYIFKSITCDNGSEFLNQELIENSCLYNGKKRTKVYYCHPYCSNERGSNENQNKIIRRFIPKGSDVRTYTEECIKEIENYINNIPRKIFNGKSSNDIMPVNI